ncbi:GDSL-type esterase/lipase family protein [Tanticharoenia sakaeratensis]|uniref:GDSL family lipase n=1 Tax=Tanticharoenia sakaeratensis NBRC 103193 TaxID=1231623 RepID=A0A0D6MLJ6_9PROT|nr:GDSL-type esterase/lipase family protein [Tanticharoenia sakaeratensis]GAN54542.1 GDSL family lipase [Tanticharoenia sakaeratensis NBRC 103193]GBQ24481.1 lipolytic protein G-D-S-L [Tanticharoenia sakaeratensis NBRC 103193]
MTETDDMRVCFFGDSFTAGTGDDTALGWVGRAVADVRQRGVDLTAYNLGVRGETSIDIARRWNAEAGPRLPEGIRAGLVFSFGVNDCVTGVAGQMRVPVHQTIETAQSIFADAARAGWPVLMIGPPRCFEATLDLRIAALTDVLAPVCAEFDIPFLPLFHRMPDAASREGGIWQQECADGDGIHPNAGGYAMIARIVTGWDAWGAMFG